MCATVGEMHVADAPVSMTAGNAVSRGGVARTGVTAPGSSTPTLISGPVAGLNLPLRHGMREEAEVDGRLDDLLDREELVCLELSRSPGWLTRSELEIPSWLWPQAAWLNSTPRFSARFSAGVIQPSAW